MQVELDEAERASLERAMVTVRALSEAERLSLIEHALRASIRYSTAQKESVLHDWAFGLLGTIRTHAVVNMGGRRSGRAAGTLSGAQLLEALRR